MNYADIRWNDIADGEGVRVALYVSGCTRKCPGCHNQQAQDFNYGKPFTTEVEDEILNGCDHPWITGLSLLGGEPMEPSNQRVIHPFLRRFRARFGRMKDVWCWTGCTMERDLLMDSPWRTEVTNGILEELDVLVDGPYIEARRDLSLAFRGSRNQRILRFGTLRTESH